VRSSIWCEPYARRDTIIVGDGTEVRVEPRVPENTWAVLDSCWQDVEVVLDAEDQETSRVRARGQKVERVH
jgi:hypothetical protein